MVREDTDSFKKVSDEIGRAHQGCKSHLGRNRDALVDEISAILQKGQDPSLTQIGVTTEQALEDLTTP